ncbi:MAG: hypothetical protein IJU79_02915 [Desulfovibrionaceae bacterium]|nr:hypothetical protein [Desulfovibrionaceae bacterium]
MRRFYQESWQGIPFTKISHLSFFHLAGSKFYSTFYEEMFARYSSWEALPLEWRENKHCTADWLINRIKQHRKALNLAPNEPYRVLSIGCGIGYVEKLLLDAMPDLELHVNEPSTVGLKWLRSYLPAEHVYIGIPPTFPSDIYYNLIYLSAVDYTISTRDLINLLENLRAQLEPAGEVVILSSSFLQEDSIIGSFVNAIKILIRGVLHYLGVRPQQFWGWRRTRKDYWQLLKQVGFFQVEDGFLEKSPETYWIVGK